MTKTLKSIFVQQRIEADVLVHCVNLAFRLIFEHYVDGATELKHYDYEIVDISVFT